jgi:hypothetical protein
MFLEPEAPDESDDESYAPCLIETEDEWEAESEDDDED